MLIFSFNAFVTVQVVALEVVQGNDRSNEKGEFYPTYPRPFTDSDETRMYKVFFANFYLNLNTWMVWQPATACFFFPHGLHFSYCARAFVDQILDSVQTWSRIGILKQKRKCVQFLTIIYIVLWSIYYCDWFWHWHIIFRSTASAWRTTLRKYVLLCAYIMEGLGKDFYYTINNTLVNIFYSFTLAYSGKSDAWLKSICRLFRSTT